VAEVIFRKVAEAPQARCMAAIAAVAVAVEITED